MLADQNPAAEEEQAGSDEAGSDEWVDLDGTQELDGFGLPEEATSSQQPIDEALAAPKPAQAGNPTAFSLFAH